jgi:cytochrome c biogenesis protein CcdA/thiol-disulfide isomerase/thioredoxin
MLKLTYFKPMKKRIFFIILILGLILGGSNFAFSAESSSENICAVYFTGVGCSHCARTDPIILEDLLREYPNLIIVEYEIYQQRENAPLLEKYNENYNSGLGIPLIIFKEDEHLIGDKPILDNVREIIEKLGANSCPLMAGSSQNFEDLDLAALPGKPKIWTQNRVLIKAGEEDEWIFGWNGDVVKEQSSKEINSNQILQKLVVTEDIPSTISEIRYSSIGSIKIPLSGKYADFLNAIDFRAEAGQEVPIREKLTLAKILSLGAIDAVNPCALAVLSLMLIAILTYNPSKKRNILLAGFAFVFSVFVMYLIYGLIIVKSFQIIQALTSIRLLLYKILGGGAIVLGFFKLRDFVRSKAVCKVVPKVNKIISKITSPKGAFLVGAFVTIFLLPCTIGPYIICGGILSSLCLLKAIPMLLLYNLIFILPMIAVVLIIYFGLSKIEDISAWQAKNIKYLDLISGLIILGLGVAMILGLV